MYTQLRFGLLQSQMDGIARQQEEQRQLQQQQQQQCEGKGLQGKGAVMNRQAHAVCDQGEGAQQGCTTENGVCDPHGQRQGQGSRGAGAAGSNPLQRLQSFLCGKQRRRRVVASLAFGALSLLDPHKAAVRAAQACSLLLLVHSTQGAAGR